MASTFTPNSGIELIEDGDQSGLWGQTTNLNLDIIDRSLSGSASITITGTTHTLTTSDGVLSDGQNRVLIFTGSPSGPNTVTIAPNTAQKLYHVRNNTSEDVILSQGSGSTVTVPPGKRKVVYTTGAGASASVFDIGGLELRGAPITIMASGTYTPDASVRMVVVEVQGAGGSGGGSAVLSGGDRGAASGGGGEGGYAFRVILNPQPATVTIGAGGVGVNGGTNTGNGTSGGNTVYSAGAITITGHGGERAPGTNSGGINATSRAGGDGGNASGGNINIRGQTGGHGFAIGLNALNGNRVIAVGGHGARSRFGRGGAGGCDDGISATGSNGLSGGFGGGGGGATRIIGGTNGNKGGNGGDGRVRIWEYI